ncbi:MAG: Asp-tRNA(Asn)/Glu-tRNA(Gln) amidotransferase subunit GatC [Verrucomicrobiota bacterium]|jgi:aspartyl-tRNA(Asn)/glutamyl-tRNA(Gln) amidotransferase subunit C|nr:Asp-tRNA(Asn)/Glu-tRNA(Gln) amidotransferase subunit GatC [Verrucomicrobiota bacterium]|tara:strand:- start:618 stop:896 length:279 start_codon:yes stop_codon:yes gene_type:complete
MEIDLQHVVNLARIDLSPEEEARIQPQMQEILKYVDKLNELDVEGIEPMAHAVPLTNVMREDEARPSLSIGDALRNAPQQANGLFVVPKIVE